MTNKEYTLKYFNEHEDKLVDMIKTYDCGFCDDIGLKKYCRANKDMDCRDTIKSWLSMERNINFELGDICEVMCLPSITELWYYVGAQFCYYYFAKTKEEVEQISKSGIGHYPKNNLKCFYINDIESFVKKVGD